MHGAGTYVLAIVYFILMLIDFVGVSIICDGYLVISIERICEVLKIPDEAAGASFLAFGSSAPEILIAVISVATAKDGEGPELGFSTVLGSAVIAFGLIPSLCRIVAPSRLELDLWALVRDVVFAIVAFGSLLLFMQDGQFAMFESGILMALFPLYLLTIFLPLKLRERREAPQNKDLLESLNSGQVQSDVVSSPHHDIEDRDAVEEDEDEEKGETDKKRDILNLVGEDGTMTQVGSTADDLEVETYGANPGRCVKLYEFIAHPFEILFKYTCPNCARGEPMENWYILCFIISLIYLGGFSFLSVMFTQYISETFDIPVNLQGAFILAFGAQIPDTLASLSMARKGLGPGAVSNAIGSQTINVLLGVGVPFLFYSIVHGSAVPVNMDYDEMFVMLAGLIFVMFSYLFITLSQMRHTNKHPTKKRNPAISKAGAIGHFMVYIGATLMIIIYEVVTFYNLA